MADNIRNLLRELGPQLSSSLAKRLQETENISKVAARKRIERAKKENEIKALTGLSLKNNEQFLYTHEQIFSESFAPALLQALEESHSRYLLPLRGIAARGGQVPLSLFPTVSAFPLISNTQTAKDILGSLCALNLLEQREYAAIGPCVRLGTQIFKKAVVGEARLRARLAVENLLLNALKDWFRLQGFVSPDKVSIRSSDTDSPQFGYYKWDLVAPSYLSPLVSFPKGRPVPGFVVADVILGRILSATDIQYFLAKCTSIKHKLNSRPFLAFLIADWFEKDALFYGRNNGLIFTTPKNLFSLSLAKGIDAISQLIQIESSIPNRQSHFEFVRDAVIATEQMDQTNKELKQLAFELLVGHCLKVLHQDTNVSFVHGSDYDQYDIFSLCQQHGCMEFAEFKTSLLITVEMLTSWIKRASAVYSEFIRDHQFRSYKVTFSFWTTGTFTQETLAYVTAQSSQFPFKLVLYDWNSLTQIAQSFLDPKTLESFKPFYQKALDVISLVPAQLQFEEE